ncbi:energy transducer TonB [Flavobacterium jejuense]|uniref:Energy transducer TonB n=1 Tax=Flavobacterium jejuense TaxID=1544455 RepID=A0ABX0IXT3_9FLAO|nr:energy transducer TonB [Flavobacterium jejuense]NHN28060.1 energy transducer TonB [Flavobacterium jejuense]
MKNILFIFLFVSIFGFSQEEDYSKIFSNFDSIKKKEINFYLNEIIDLSQYEFIKDNNSENNNTSQNILFTLKLDSIGRFKIIYIDKKSEKLVPFFESIFKKIPSIEIKKINNTESTYISADFKLYVSLETPKFNKIKERLFSNENDSIKNITSLDIYPTFGAFKKNTDKEKSIKHFNKKISKHIKENFKYPDYAIKKGLTGKTFVFFLIEKNGAVERILSSNSHPIFQHEGIRIIKKLPKLNPGFINEKPVRVIYGLPLTFKLK